MDKKLTEKLKTLPARPGVYFHKSQTGEVIYVGKAAVLKNRVRQYFQSKKNFDVKTLALVSEIADTDWIETESEIDALFLESEMVKRYMPRFNILLRDDRSQMFVRINMRDEFPHVEFTRAPMDDAADYIGPFYNGYAVKKAMRYLRKVFPYYIKPPVHRHRDLDVHIGLNPDPDMTSREYKTTLRKLLRYIKGERVALTKEIERDMQRAANNHQFETAAALRNKLQNLRELQRRIMFGDREFLDISKDKALSDLQQLFGLSRIPVRIECYDISHMSGSNVVASMVVFTNGVSDRGEYRKFKMANQRNDDYKNIYETIYRRLSDKNLKAWGSPDLIIIDGGKGQLDAALKAMEERSVTLPCVSIAKREEVIIVHKSRSRVNEQSVREVATRHERTIWIDESTDHLMINLHADQRNASGHSKNLRGGSQTNAFTDVTKLFQRIRDESHRFAVSYHTVLKRSGQTQSMLDTISGIGPVTKKKLLAKFGSVPGIANASDEDLRIVIGPRMTELIRAHIPSARPSTEP